MTDAIVQVPPYRDLEWACQVCDRRYGPSVDFSVTCHGLPLRAKPVKRETTDSLAAQDWLIAEREFLAQRPLDGSIPRKQLWGDTIAKGAYAIFKSRERSGESRAK
jgi:hypothetical protein